MKEITLNQDGTLNILNPDKLYVMRFDWFRADEPSLGIKYYIATKVQDKQWSFIRDTDAWFNSSLDANDLQYCVDKMLRHNNFYHNGRFNIFEFNNYQDFSQYLEQENNTQPAL